MKGRPDDSLGKGALDGPARQLAALPYRVVQGRVEVLLVTSRETCRWIVPKGWPMKGVKPHKAAAIEALEEAGIRGDVGKDPIGKYEAWKRLTAAFVLVELDVYPLLVRAEMPKWKEADQRRRQWFPYCIAAEAVDEPGLSQIISAFGDQQSAKLI